jgi:anti-anti-sigma regulatory factor
MTLPIDLKEILRQTVADGYGDLVTRRTGQAVRKRIERILAHTDGETVLIDFGSVRCLDLSCADEIVGRLLRERAKERSFVLLNLDDGHREAIEFVLERNNLAALVKTKSGELQVLGTLSEPASRAFTALVQLGAAAAEEVAEATGLPPNSAAAVLEELCRLRLIVREKDSYRAPVAERR